MPIYAKLLVGSSIKEFRVESVVLPPKAVEAYIKLVENGGLRQNYLLDPRSKNFEWKFGFFDPKQ